MMTFGFTEEMNELYAFFSKWMEKRVKKDSPQEVKDAEKRFLELLATEEKRQRPLIENGKQDFLIPTKEMNELEKVIEPWLEWRAADNAPEGVEEAKKNMMSCTNMNMNARCAWKDIFD